MYVHTHKSTGTHTHTPSEIMGQLRTAYPQGTLPPLFGASYINNALRKEFEAK